MNSGNDDVGDSQVETKFLPPIIPRTDEEIPASVDGNRKIGSAKDRHTSFSFKAPVVDGMTHLRLIQELRAENSKLRSRNLKLKCFTVALTLCFASTLICMGSIFYFHFSTNLKANTSEPMACDQFKMELSLQAEVLANLSLQIQSIQSWSERVTSNTHHNTSEAYVPSPKSWSSSQPSQPMLNWA